MNLDNNWMQLYIKSGSESFEVVHVCHSLEDVNKYCLNNDKCGLIATDDNGLHYIARDQPEAS